MGKLVVSEFIKRNAKIFQHQQEEGDSESGDQCGGHDPGRVTSQTVTVPQSPPARALRPGRRAGRVWNIYFKFQVLSRRSLQSEF